MSDITSRKSRQARITRQLDELTMNPAFIRDGSADMPTTAHDAPTTGLIAWILAGALLSIVLVVGFIIGIALH